MLDPGEMSDSRSLEERRGRTRYGLKKIQLKLYYIFRKGEGTAERVKELEDWRANIKEKSKEEKNA